MQLDWRSACLAWSVLLTGFDVRTHILLQQAYLLACQACMGHATMQERHALGVYTVVAAGNVILLTGIVT